VMAVYDALAGVGRGEEPPCLRALLYCMLSCCQAVHMGVGLNSRQDDEYEAVCTAVCTAICTAICTAVCTTSSACL
jgi:hypothetical protein